MLLECHLSRNLVDGNKVWKIWLSLNSLVGKNIFVVLVGWVVEITYKVSLFLPNVSFLFFYDSVVDVKIITGCLWS